MKDRGWVRVKGTLNVRAMVRNESGLYLLGAKHNGDEYEKFRTFVLCFILFTWE